jgi:hypothetical protein
MRCFVSRWPDGSYSLSIFESDAPEVSEFARLLDQEDDSNEAQIWEIIPEFGVSHVSIPHEKKLHHGDTPFAYDGLLSEWDWPE